MKILLVVPFLPYAGAGHAGSKFANYLLRTLAANNEVYLVTRSFPGEERQIPLLREMVTGLEVVEGPGAYSTSSLYMLCRVIMSYRRLALLAHRVLQRERFDICQVEYTESGVFWKAPASTPAVLTFIDVMAKPARRRYLSARGLRRIAAWGNWQVTKAVEAFVASKFQRTFTLSEEDRRWAHNLYPHTAVRVLRYPAGIEFVGLPRREAPLRLLFVGALNRPPNLEAIQWFVDGCWPTIRRESPGVEFHIVGHGMPEGHRVRWSVDPAIKIVGPVDSVEPHYKEATVFIAPILTGGGIIVKILDALGAGVPVVTTTRGNEGIDAENEKSVLIADTADLFATSVVRLLRNQALRETIGQSARRHVDHAFSPSAFASTLHATYSELMQKRALSC